MFNILIGGDFNCPLSASDKFGGKDIQLKKNVIHSVEALCNNYDLVDSWREQHPHEMQFTWRNSSGKIKCRLDFWLISKRLLSRVTKTDICAYYESDHSPVTISIKPEDIQEKRGPGYWKLKNDTLTRLPKQFLWESNSSPKFKVLQSSSMQILIQDYLDDIKSAQNVNTSVEQVENILIATAKRCLKIRTVRRHKRTYSSPNKKWFDKECRLKKARVKKTFKRKTQRSFERQGTRKISYNLFFFFLHFIYLHYV